MSSRLGSTTPGSRPTRPTSAVSRANASARVPASSPAAKGLTTDRNSRPKQESQEAKTSDNSVSPSDGESTAGESSKQSEVGSLRSLSISVDNDAATNNAPKSSTVSTRGSLASTSGSVARKPLGTAKATPAGTAPTSTASARTASSIRRVPTGAASTQVSSSTARPATSRASVSSSSSVSARNSTSGAGSRPTSALGGATSRASTSGAASGGRAVLSRPTTNSRPNSTKRETASGLSKAEADEASDTIGFAPVTPRRTSMIGTGRPITSSEKAKTKQRAHVASQAVRLIQESAANSNNPHAVDPVATRLHEALASVASPGGNASGATEAADGDVSQDPEFLQNLLSSLKRLSIAPANEGEGLSQRMKNFLASTYDPSNPEAGGVPVESKSESDSGALPVPVIEEGKPEGVEGGDETVPASEGAVVEGAPAPEVVVAENAGSPRSGRSHHRRKSSQNPNRSVFHQRTKSGRIPLPEQQEVKPRQLAGSRVTQLVAQFEKRAAEANAPTLADIAAEQRRQLEAYSQRTQILAENCEQLSVRAKDAEQKTQELEKRYTVDKAELERALQQSRELLQEATKDSESKAYDLSVCKAQLSAYQQQVASLQSQIELLQAKLRLSDKVRKHLHNQVLELKGNIRVFCRVRPLLSSDGDQGTTAANLGPVFSFPVTVAQGLGGSVLNTDSASESKSAADEQSLIQEAGLVEHNSLIFRGPEERSLDGTRTTAKKHSFTFDRVFTPEDGNSVVFSEVAQLVQSALDGYKICIFAYGQTGSGKTHTMEGDGIDSITTPPSDASSGTPEVQFPPGVGITSRTVHTIFAETQRLKKEQGWKHTCRVQILEVYMDTVYTLLPSGKTETGELVSPLDAAKRIASGWDPYLVEAKSAAAMASSTSTANGAGSPTPAPSLESPVIGCDPIVVNSAGEVFALLSVASAMRKTRDTAMNARSSRSHVLFQLIVEGVNPKTGETRQGALTLVDLAGSERVKQSQVTGRSLDEATSINQSLSALGNVIAALGTSKKHVPFRESKLTMLLQSSLGPDSKTLMLVNLSPAEAHTNESLCSLRFAEKVNACHIGVAQKNVKMT